MDHMRISGNEPSLVILSQTKWIPKLKMIENELMTTERSCLIQHRCEI